MDAVVDAMQPSGAVSRTDGVVGQPASVELARRHHRVLAGSDARHGNVTRRLVGVGDVTFLAVEASFVTGAVGG